MFTKVAVSDYGLVKRGDEYEVVDEDGDWLVIKVQGKSIYTFKWVFE